MAANTSVPTLPGFAAFLERDVDRAGAKDLKAKEYTAERVLRDYPGTYQAVSRALFFYKLPVKTCCDLFRMNSACVAAIRDQVIAASQHDRGAAFLVNSRRQSQRDIVIARLTEAIAEKLSSEATVAEMSVDELVGLLKRLEDAPKARNGTDAANAGGRQPNEDVIEAEQFDEVVNGLSGQKNSRAEMGADEGELEAEDAPSAVAGSPLGAEDCSTESEI